MPDYRRAKVKGATYFFTLATLDRRPIMTEEALRSALRQAIREVKASKPFDVIAWVLLPEHMHAIWQLPEHDADYSARWSAIKRLVTKQCRTLASPQTSLSRQQRREGTLWQRRFWEHLIRDEADLQRHVDYIHYNPVKHGYVACAQDWPYSTFHRYVREGIYPMDWGAAESQLTGEFGE